MVSFIAVLIAPIIAYAIEWLWYAIWCALEWLRIIMGVKVEHGMPEVDRDMPDVERGTPAKP